VIDLPPMNYPQTIEALAQCGIPAARARISYDPELQLDVVSIDPLPAPPSDELLACVYRATAPAGYYVEFSDAEQNGAFWALALDEGRRRARLEGQQWLQDHGLLAGMPVYRAGETDLAAFARDVEAYCSIAPGTAIEVVDAALVTLRPEFARSIADSGDGGKLTCLVNVMAASNLADGGVDFGIIANGPISNGPESH
jgi:hypothetical protein